MNSALQYERFDMPYMYIGPILKIYGLRPRRKMGAILDSGLPFLPKKMEKPEDIQKRLLTDFIAVPIIN